MDLTEAKLREEAVWQSVLSLAQLLSEKGFLMKKFLCRMRLVPTGRRPARAERRCKDMVCLGLLETRQTWIWIPRGSWIDERARRCPFCFSMASKWNS